MEAISDGSTLKRAAERALMKRKPIVALKASRSDSGAKAALTHTASMTGSSQVFRAAMDRYGVTFVEELEKVVDAIKAFRQVAVIFVDIDNFKMLNDTKGHDAGDVALKTVAQILKEHIEGKGLAGRYGGEEMVLLVSRPMTTIEDFAEQVRFRIERESIVTASIGFAEWAPGVTVEQLVKNADAAMYNSKQTGKNRVTGYSI
jgi:diguanylate cyclase (GGDEF)-like protein